MLDTIILQLDSSKFFITDYGKFGTTKERVNSGVRMFRKWHNNPTPNDKKLGLYKPRLTLLQRGLLLQLKIEFSAPKILFGNNVEELEENDFDEVVKILQCRLKDMGVVIWKKFIEEAEILSFHVSKNIVLSNGYTSSLAIKELSKLDLSKRFDFDEKKYRNNGEVIQFYTNSHSFVIYDKINDLVKPRKRATDKDQTEKQLTIFDYLKGNNTRTELLRLEVRLILKRKINQVLEQNGFANNPLFKDVFKKELCKKILNTYWSDFFSENRFLLSLKNNPQDIFQMIFIRFPGTKILKAIKLVGLYTLCRDEAGMRGFRQTVNSYKPNTNWQAVKKDLKIFEDEIFSRSVWGFVKDIERQLNIFNSLKLKL